MLRALTVALLGTALAGCVQMQVNNAQVFADQAKRIAENCPAAAEAAAQAQAAADRAARAGDVVAGNSSEAGEQRSQAEYWAQRAEEHAARAEALDREVERLRASRSAREAALRAQGEACHNAVSFCFGVDTVIPNVGASCDELLRSCGCSSEATCTAAGDDARQRLEGGTSDLDRQIAAAEEGASQARTLAADAREQAEHFSYLAGAYEDAASGWSTVLAEAERDAQEAAEAAAEACDESLFSEAPAPDGTYSQDVFGAQNQGLGGVLGTAAGACSPAMQASCLAIQFDCNVGCGPPGAPTSCSPGAPADCLACFAAGCI